jgi:hypothetical protein
MEQCLQILASLRLGQMSWLPFDGQLKLNGCEHPVGEASILDLMGVRILLEKASILDRGCHQLEAIEGLAHIHKDTHWRLQRSGIMSLHWPSVETLHDNV